MTQRVVRTDAGFTLVELLVAMVLVAIVMVLLFPVTYKVALQSRQANVVTQRNTTAAAEIERVTSADFTTLATGTTCTTFSASHFPHIKCVTISDINPNRKQVTVIVTPLNGSGVGPDTSVVQRSRGKAGNPLNVPP